jgi:hypothetical protein
VYFQLRIQVWRDKQYSVILSIRAKWKWFAEIEGHTRLGVATDVKMAEGPIDKAGRRRESG